jgi:glycosyltransferase involved in cell wall biosynthesis
MRVLITTDSFPPGCGGSGWSTYELARTLRARAYDVRIVHLRAGRSGAGERCYEDFTIDELGVPAPPLPFVRNYFKNERSYRRLVPPLRRIIADGRFDIVHAQHVLSAPPSIAAARLERVPVVCTIRDYWPVCYWSDLIHDPASSGLCPACSRAMMMRCIRPRAGAAWPLAVPLVPYMAANLRRKRIAIAGADAVIAVSSVLARDLVARAPELAGVRLETIPNPVDIEVITRPTGRQHPFDGRPYAVYAGKLAPNKGVAALIPACERANLPWPLVVIGDGPERDAVERAATQSRRDVRMLGWLERPDALNWLAHARLVVFPSYGPESLSRVLLEASALGRPIAAMDTGGTGDIIVDGKTGLLTHTMEELAGAIARIAADPDLAESLGSGAAAFVRERFDAKRVVARIEALYRELVQSGPAARAAAHTAGAGSSPRAATEEVSGGHD